MSSGEIALPQIKLRAGKSKNYDLQSVCSTCKNVLYMYRIFCCCFSCRHVAKERFSDSFVSYKTSQWFGLA